MHADLDRAELDAFAAHYHQFHDVMWEATPNRVLVEAIVELRETSRRFHRVHRCEAVLRGSEQALRRVWRLVRWRDAEAVVRAVREHRSKALERIVQLSSREERSRLGV
jgi:DNA-binding FadR family transcriptional regulator